jgi:hypothetical protein
MKEREILMAEVKQRSLLVAGVARVLRNPVTPPKIGDLPAIHIFEMEDSVIQVSSRGRYPLYTRKLIILIELFTTATTEALASETLGSFVQEFKKRLYAGGVNLGGRCSEIKETGTTRILRPPIENHSAGVGLLFEIKYIENIDTLM